VNTVNYEPTVQASNIVDEIIASRSFRLTWTPGNGDGSIVTIREQGTPEVAPVDGTDYTADNDINIAPETSPSSGNFVVYKGNGSLAQIVGLTNGTTYIITVYAWGGFGADTDYLHTAAPFVTWTADGPAMHNWDNSADCSNCHINHGNNGMVPTGANQVAVCESCHRDTGPASAKVNFAMHNTPNYPAADDVACGDCHEVHKPVAPETTESTRPAALGGGKAYNNSFIRANVSDYVATATTDDALFHSTDDFAIEGGDETTSRGICQACHTNTDYHRNNSAIVASQCHKGGTNDTCDGGQVICTDCHEHKKAFAPGGSCTGCHSDVQDKDDQEAGDRRAIMDEFKDPYLGMHVKPAGSVTDADCEVCHAQSGAGATAHTHQDGYVTLWNVDNNTADAFQTTTRYANAFSVQAERDELTGFCIRCHDGDGALMLGANALTPFSSGVEPPVVDETHWLASGHEDGTVTCFGDGTNGCHSSGHGSRKQFLLAPYDVPATDPNRSEEREEFCFECHDVTDGPGMSTLKIQDDFSGAAVIATSQAGALTNNRHDVMPADRARSGGIVTCKDCHQPHLNTNNDPVRDPDDDQLLGPYDTANRYQTQAPDPVLDYAYWDTSSDLDPTDPLGVLAEPVKDYIPFCLTCHDGTPPGSVTMSANLVDMADAYFVVPDQHGSGDGQGSKKGYLKAPFSDGASHTANPFAAMNCTTCHDTHGSVNIYNLRESITVGTTVMTIGSTSGGFSGWPANDTDYTLPSAGFTPTGNQTDHYWGAWCTFCHNMTGHNVDQATDCSDGHKHGGGNF
jgi:predicted CXXCH cytochrome family protein